MSADATEVPVRSPSPAAKRMRERRKRLGAGIRLVPIALHVTQIEGLIRKGILRREDQGDLEAIAWAVDVALEMVLDDPALHVTR
jgi:hypothetical protein